MSQLTRAVRRIAVGMTGFCLLLAPGAHARAAPPTDAKSEDPCTLRSALADALAANPALTWADIREACERDVEAAKRRDPLGLAWFANAGNGLVGTPLVLMKTLPDLAPEIWGDADDFYGSFGLFPDPDEPDRILPRGLGVTGGSARPMGSDGRPSGEIDYSTPSILVVSLACGACHSGRIQTGDGHRVLEGAPNSQFDVRKWRRAFTQTMRSYLAPEQIGSVERPGETTRRLIEIVDAKPAGYFARGLPGLAPEQLDAMDRLQRRLFKDNAVSILQRFAAGTRMRADAVELQAHPGSSYGHGDRSPGLAGFSAGQSDGSGDLMVDLLIARYEGAGKSLDEILAMPHPELPPFATVTDIPSVWNQEDRAVGQWDGSVLSRFWRNIAAQLPIVGQPSAIDLVNTSIVAESLLGLPSPPYPFEVDLTKAAEGEALFREHCVDCHRPRNDRRYWELQTDFNRAQVLTPAGAELFLSAFQAACHDKEFSYVDRNGRRTRPCAEPPQHILRDTTLASNQGYIASVLDGIWARAPYLHNGSVPTLRHLLVPSTRPERFLRGVIELDRENLGWMWDVQLEARYAETMPTLSEHDTSRDGWTNVGHDKDLVIDGKLHRLDWSGAEHAAELESLLEYMKTL